MGVGRSRLACTSRHSVRADLLSDYRFRPEPDFGRTKVNVVHEVYYIDGLVE